MNLWQGTYNPDSKLWCLPSHAWTFECSATRPHLLTFAASHDHMSMFFLVPVFGKTSDSLNNCGIHLMTTDSFHDCSDLLNDCCKKVIFLRSPEISHFMTVEAVYCVNGWDSAGWQWCTGTNDNTHSSRNVFSGNFKALRMVSLQPHQKWLDG